jgi:hypothetical protein
LPWVNFLIIGLCFLVHITFPAGLPWVEPHPLFLLEGWQLPRWGRGP